MTHLRWRFASHDVGCCVALTKGCAQDQPTGLEAPLLWQKHGLHCWLRVCFASLHCFTQFERLHRTVLRHTHEGIELQQQAATSPLPARLRRHLRRASCEYPLVRRLSHPGQRCASSAASSSCAESVDCTTATPSCSPPDTGVGALCLRSSPAATTRTTRLGTLCLFYTCEAVDAA